MNDIELKACPFCGNDPEFKVGYHMTVDVKVGCDECGAEGPVFGTNAHSGDFRFQAAEAWNRRPSLTPPKGYVRAVDRELVTAEIGVANHDDSFEVASQKLHELIMWHVKVATDPTVNGGFVLVPVEPTPAMVEAAARAYMPFGDMEAALRMAILAEVSL